MNDNPEQPERSEHDICRSCGLCCDGTLFKWARFTETDDADTIRRTGLEVVSVKNKLHISLPCPMHRGECTVYAQRPGPCRVYICKLLQNYDAGNVSWEKAMADVAEVRALRDDLRRECVGKHIPGAGNMHALHRFLTAVTGNEARAYGPVLIKYAALVARLRHLFIQPSDRQFLRESIAETSQETR